MAKVFSLLVVVCLCVLWFKGLSGNPLGSQSRTDDYDFDDEEAPERIVRTRKKREVARNSDVVENVHVKPDKEDYDNSFLNDNSIHNGGPPKQINDDCEIMHFIVRKKAKEYDYIKEVWQDTYTNVRDKEVKVLSLYSLFNTTYILPPKYLSPSKTDPKCIKLFGKICVETEKTVLVKSITTVRRVVTFSLIDGFRRRSVDVDTFKSVEIMNKTVFQNLKKLDRTTTKTDNYTKDPCYELDERRFMECRPSKQDPSKNQCQCQQDHRPGIEPGTEWLVYSEKLKECVVPVMGICNAFFHEDYWLQCEYPSKCSYTTGLQTDYVYCSPPKNISIFFYNDTASKSDSGLLYKNNQVLYVITTCWLIMFTFVTTQVGSSLY